MPLDKVDLAKQLQRSLAVTPANAAEHKQSKTPATNCVGNVYRTLREYQPKLAVFLQELSVPPPHEDSVQILQFALARMSMIKDGHDSLELSHKSFVWNFDVYRALTHNAAKTLIDDITRTGLNPNTEAEAAERGGGKDVSLFRLRKTQVGVSKDEATTALEVDSLCGQMECRDALLTVLKPVISTASHELFTDYINGRESVGAFGFAEIMYERMPIKLADITEAYGMVTTDNSENTKKFFVEVLLENVRVEKQAVVS